MRINQDNFFGRVGDYLFGGHERSIKAKKNILASIALKGGSIVVSLLLVPLTINYVNPSGYGIWLTLSSIVAWFAFFDIGLTQGLRNKFAEAKARGDDSLARTYVSTTYAFLAVIFLFIWLLFLAVNPFLSWSKILNASNVSSTELSVLALIVFSYFCLSFILRIISTVLTADQQPAKASIIDFLGQLISLAVVWVFVKTTQGSLVNLGIALCAAPLFVLVFSNLYYFNGPYKKFRPVFSAVDFTKLKGLLGLGMVFFVIQVAGIVQFQTANIIIAQFFGPADVTSYNIVYKYFGILHMGFIIFITPFWSASTEAYIKNDIQWIKNGIKQYNLLNLGVFLLSIVMLVFSAKVYDFWLGQGTVNIPFMLSFWGFVFFNTIIFALKYVFFLNGINALRLQFIASIISPVVFFIVAYILIKLYQLGVYSLFIASVIANFNGFIIAPLQYHLVVNKKKKGIWIK